MEWAGREGWNPGLHDAEAFYRADPAGYFVGLLSGAPVACISAVAYSDTFGFLGLYIVKPEHRSRGLETKIWEVAPEHLDDRNVGHDGVAARQADYEKYGFRFVYRNWCYAGTFAIPDKPSGNIVDLKNVKTSKIVEYDSRCFRQSAAISSQGGSASNRAGRQATCQETGSQVTALCTPALQGSR